MANYGLDALPEICEENAGKDMVVNSIVDLEAVPRNQRRCK